MEFTGKNKEQFEVWYNSQKDNETNRLDFFITSFGNIPLPFFYDLDFRLQVGVYIAYADSLGMPISIELFDEDEMHYFKIYPSTTYSDTDGFDNQPEAQIAALKAFDNLINNN
jgi:hypothetical protein